MSDLPNKFPQGTPFQQFRGQGEPYCCSEWKYDRQDVFCMYFEFPPHEKKIPLSEIEAATRYLNSMRVFAQFPPMRVDVGSRSLGNFGKNVQR